MAEALLTFAAEGILTKVTSLAAQEFTLVLGLKEDVAQLRDSFLKIQAMLRDVDHSNKHGEAVESWVKDLEDVAQKADDVLDEIGYEVLRRKIELQDQMKKKVKNFFSSSNPTAFRLKMAHKIKKINTALEVLFKQAAGPIGLVARTLSDSASHDVEVPDRETLSSFDSDERLITGREEVVSDIVKTLIKSHYAEEDYLPVLAVVGMPGLGKTTLAKSIYHQPEIDKHFHEKIWVCVSTPFEVKTILRGILEVLKPEKAAVQSKDAICKFIREELKEKRYLLVLDDVWSEDPEKWKDLRSCLLTIKATQGSSIIVTTRSKKVANIMESLPRCNLGRLSDDDCWLLIKDKAVSDSISKEQETTGKEIAKKCGGVPLLAKVLGNVLRSKTSDEEWRSIAKSKIWDLPEGERVVSILKLSFDELKPPSLKQCLAYCSMFAKDFDLDKDDLIQLWMAQGWLHSYSDKGVEMEERGNEYFNILLGKSFFQDVTKDDSGNVVKCKMHDLVHDLAERVSKKGNSSSPFSNGDALGSTLLNSKSLRVLNLYKADITELPVSIGKLKHLRYLNVLKTKIKTFPKSIGELYNLQTLKIPYHLEEFPIEIANLINLRHIYFGRYMKVPSGILGRLANLRTLPFLKVGKETGPKIEELSGLNQLQGTLSLYELKNVGDGKEAQKANLVEKKHIRKLILSWERGRPSQIAKNEDGVLGGLQPHSNLEFLVIQGFMGVKFPSWLLEANKLKEIRLIGCHNSEELPVLGHLPNLTCVMIVSMENLTCIRPEFYGDNLVNCGNGLSTEARPLFPCLKTLHIEEAQNLIEWMEAPRERGSGVFPSLEELTLIHCGRLTSAPSHFPSLKKLVIKEMSSGGRPIASILSNQLTTLTDLFLCDVGGLTCLPEGFLENNKNLADLELINCKALTRISPRSQAPEFCCASLSKILILDCPKLRYLPDGILTPALKTLRLFDCGNLEYIPDATDGGLTSLESLTVLYCNKITWIPFSQGLPSLVELSISYCPELSSLPGGLENCASIRSLEIRDCPKLPSISIGSLTTSLQELTVSNLDCLPISPKGFTSLREFTLETRGYVIGPEFGPKFGALLQTLVSLESLTIWNCEQLETIPSSDKFASLRSLVITYCAKIKYLPDGLAASSCRLKELILGPFCNELDAFPALPAMPQLESLTIRGWDKLKSLPEQIQHLPSLTRLQIMFFNGMEAMPEWLGNLASLEDLKVLSCMSLKYLPSVQAMQRLSKLEQIDISGCDLLEERCKEESGPEWPKICHLPFITSKTSFPSFTQLVPSILSLHSSLRFYSENANELKLVFEKFLFPALTNTPKCLPKCLRKTTPELFHAEREGLPDQLEIVDEGSTIMKGDNVDLDDAKSLTPSLKLLLFLYCSLFPLDYEFRKYEIIQLWIAQGFIGETKMETMEDTGLSYFTAMEVEGYFVRSKHDLLLDFDSLFSVPVYNPSNFLYKVNATKISVLDKRNDGGNYFQAENVGQLCEASELLTKHLSLKISENNDDMTFGVVQKFKNLQTLLLFCSSVSTIKHVPRDLFLSLHELRTLNLSRALISGLPSSIGDARELRYLDVSYTPITQLPESVSSLHQLQTLKLRGCVHFSMLPRTTKNLTNLRHIELDIILQLDSMPTYMGNLTKLQTLSAFLVGTDVGCRINELTNLNDLKGALSVSGLENVINKKEAEEAALMNKKYLQRLNLRWSNVIADEENLTVQNKEKRKNIDEEEILTSLRPPYELKELQIEHYAGLVLPTWISDPLFADLVVMTLYRCKYCKFLPCLGQLPGLQSLSIIEMNAVEEINHEFFKINRVDQSLQAFPKLEMLEVDIMLNLKDWTGVQIGDLPALHKLTVKSCPELISIPSLSNLKSLKHLEFRRCAKLPSLPNDGLPTSLESFILKDCPQLGKSCINVKGEDWRKICCVPNVWIDDEEIISQGSSQMDSDNVVTPSLNDKIQPVADEDLMQCLEILNNMEEIDDDSYSKAVKFFHGESSWRKVFVHMAEKRRKSFILSL